MNDTAADESREGSSRRPGSSEQFEELARAAAEEKQAAGRDRPGCRRRSRPKPRSAHGARRLMQRPAGELRSKGAETADAEDGAETTKR